MHCLWLCDFILISITFILAASQRCVQKQKVTSPVVRATPCLGPTQPPPHLLLFWNISIFLNMQHIH